MEETKVFEEVGNVVMDEGVQEAAKDVVVETVKTAAKINPWAVVLLIIAGIGLIATGGWIVFAIIFLVKFLKKKFPKKITPEQYDKKVEAGKINPEDVEEIIEE